MNRLAGILPDERFITIHPALLGIMGYHEAALLHEIHWRAQKDAEQKPARWVRKPPAYWQETLHLSAKQLRVAVDACLTRGWIEATKEGLFGDQLRSFRICEQQLEEDLARKAAGETMCPKGQLRSAQKGRCHLPDRADVEEEPLEVPFEAHFQCSTPSSETLEADIKAKRKNTYDLIESHLPGLKRGERGAVLKLIEAAHNERVALDEVLALDAGATLDDVIAELTTSPFDAWNIIRAVDKDESRMGA